MTLPISIFYADDDQDDLDFFHLAAEDLSCEIHLFNKGEEFVEKLKNPPPTPSVVFLDLNMPTRNGFEILKDIKNSELKDTKVIVFSTSDSNESIAKSKKLGADFYLIKPTSISKLEKALKQIVANILHDTIALKSKFLLEF